MTGPPEIAELDIIITGRGGQGTKLAAQLLASAAAVDGYFPLHYSVYGALIRGGDIASTIVIGSAPPRCALRDSFAIMVAAHNNWFVRYYEFIRPGGILVYDPDSVPERLLTRSDLRHWPIGTGALAAEAGDHRAGNMVVAGACARIAGVPSLEGLDDAMASVVPAHRQDRIRRNLAAVRSGWNWGEKVTSELGETGRS
ncbi:MAG TPA: 2-oxoacid:acceptor oxidoreductase family protein [Candidatus Dormibacteraeota bacterium]|nr:2-oxoacid:acceptor oxidoreductase family protein [Candidatus Dormibacteraeota bacterium]